MIVVYVSVTFCVLLPAGGRILVIVIVMAQAKSGYVVIVVLSRAVVAESNVSHLERFRTGLGWLAFEIPEA